MVENQRITAVMAGGIARIANPRYQHQRSRILVMASNLLPSNFYYGDPCMYTVKYIEVDYRCVRY